MRCPIPFSARFFAGILILFGLGYTTAFGFSFPGQTQQPPQKQSPAPKVHKTYISVNLLDPLMSGRLTIGLDRIIPIRGHYVGLCLQYTSPVNSVMRGLVTQKDNATTFSKEYQFPSSFDAFLCYYLKTQAVNGWYYARLGLSFVRNPGDTETATYLAIGPSARLIFGKNFHLTVGLSTLKFKLQGSRKYGLLILPLYDVAVGINF